MEKNKMDHSLNVYSSVEKNRKKIQKLLFSFLQEKMHNWGDNFLSRHIIFQEEHRNGSVVEIIAKAPTNFVRVLDVRSDDLFFLLSWEKT